MNNSMLRNVGAYQMAFQAMDITSLPMRHAIEDWYRLYYLQAPTKEEDPCQQIPYTIVRKLIKATFSEYSATSKDAFASQILDALQYVDSEAMQQAFIGGESFLKPVPIRDGFRFTVGKRSNLLIFGRDAAGMPIDIGISETSVHDKFYYTLLERRTVDAKGYLTIKNALYRSYTDTDLGQPVGLNSLPQYADLQEVYTFQEPVGSTGVVFVRIPMENCVDGSLDGVSVYAAAVGLIHGINRNEAQLDGEFDRAKSRLIVSADMFKKDKKGKAQLVDDILPQWMVISRIPVSPFSLLLSASRASLPGSRIICDLLKISSV